MPKSKKYNTVEDDIEETRSRLIAKKVEELDKVIDLVNGCVIQALSYRHWDKNKELISDKEIGILNALFAIIETHPHISLKEAARLSGSDRSVIYFLSKKYPTLLTEINESRKAAVKIFEQKLIQEAIGKKGKK